MVKLEDFAVGEIRKMISKYNKQVKLGGYSKMKKEELIKFVRNHDNLKVVENEKGVNISVKAGSVEAEKKAVKEKKAPPAEKKTLTREEMRKSTKTIINKKKYPDNMTDADFESMKKDAEKILKQKIPLAVIKEAHERKLADKKKRKHQHQHQHQHQRKHLRKRKHQHQKEKRKPLLLNTIIIKIK